MMMMSNVTGDFVRSMPVTVVFTLTASLLISIILTPYLSSKYIHITAETQPGKIRSYLNRFIETTYRQQLNFALKRPVLIIIISIVIFIVSLSLFPLIGVSFFPKAEKPQLLINIDTPEGTSLDYTSIITHQVEDVIKQKPDIARFMTNIGHGNPRIYQRMDQPVQCGFQP